MSETRHEASCGCGALRVTALGAPGRTMLCSCISCQKRTGTALGVSAYWPEEQTHVSGASTIWRRSGQQGRSFEHHFCPVCGTTVWWRGDFAPGMIGIAGGAFEDSNFLKPTKAYWAASRPAWLARIFDIETLERQG